MTNKNNDLIGSDIAIVGSVEDSSHIGINTPANSIEIISKTNFFRRLWILISNSFSYLFFGKIRY